MKTSLNILQHVPKITLIHLTVDVAASFREFTLGLSGNCWGSPEGEEICEMKMRLLNSWSIEVGVFLDFNFNILPVEWDCKQSMLLFILLLLQNTMSLKASIHNSQPYIKTYCLRQQNVLLQTELQLASRELGWKPHIWNVWRVCVDNGDGRWSIVIYRVWRHNMCTFTSLQQLVRFCRSTLPDCNHTSCLHMLMWVSSSWCCWIPSRLLSNKIPRLSAVQFFVTFSNAYMYEIRFWYFPTSTIDGRLCPKALPVLQVLQMVQLVQVAVAVWPRPVAPFCSPGHQPHCGTPSRGGAGDLVSKKHRLAGAYPCKFEGSLLLLMVQKSQTTTWDV